MLELLRQQGLSNSKSINVKKLALANLGLESVHVLDPNHPIRYRSVSPKRGRWEPSPQDIDGRNSQLILIDPKPTIRYRSVSPNPYQLTIAHPSPQVSCGRNPKRYNDLVEAYVPALCSGFVWTETHRVDGRPSRWPPVPSRWPPVASRRPSVVVVVVRPSSSSVRPSLLPASTLASPPVLPPPR
jgi:hypothetical protein